MTFDSERLLELAKVAAYKAGDFLRSSDTLVIKSEGRDIKINADFDSHSIITEVLAETGFPILSEEDAQHAVDAEMMWIIDPLDGSLNFSRGIPFCAVSIAFMVRGEPVIGVVYDFNRAELFTGIVGKGSWLNGEGINTSKIASKHEAILMTGFPTYTDYSASSLQQYVKLIQSFKKNRLIGSAALSLAYVASGRADAYYEKDIKTWDVMAGLAIIKAGGGTYSLSDMKEEGKVTVVACNALLDFTP